MDTSSSSPPKNELLDPNECAECVRLRVINADLLAVCLAYRDARETDDFDRTAERREQLLAAIEKATGTGG